MVCRKNPKQQQQQQQQLTIYLPDCFIIHIMQLFFKIFFVLYIFLKFYDLVYAQQPKSKARNRFFFINIYFTKNKINPFFSKEILH